MGLFGLIFPVIRGRQSVLDTAPAWQWTNQPVLVLRKTL